MSTGEKKNGDAEITQGRKDVLRGSDIIPGDSSARGTNQTSSDPAKAPKEESKNGSESKIPQFDLANDIMAEQRKITAVRRKGPGKKTTPTKELATNEVAPPDRPIRQQDSGTETDNLIADIVRRDIERLCKGLDGQ